MKYPLIYADPAWGYGNTTSNGAFVDNLEGINYVS